MRTRATLGEISDALHDMWEGVPAGVGAVQAAGCRLGGSPSSRQRSAMIHHEGTKDTKEKALGVSQLVLGAAIEVHRVLGPGLLESVYEAALCRELWIRQLRVDRQVPIRISYKGAELDGQVRCDLLVESVVIVEVKSAEKLTPIHRAQVLTYLRLTGHTVGLLLNFNVELLRQGLRRILNG